MNTGTAEELLISAILASPSIMDELIYKIKDPVVFRDEKLRNVYSAMLDLYRNGDEISEYSVMAQMAKNDGKNIEEYAWVAELSGVLRHAVGWVMYAEEIIRNYMSDRLSDLGTKLVQEGGKLDPVKMVEMIENEIASIQEIAVGDHERIYNVQRLVKLIFERIDAVSTKNSLTGVTTGYKSLDEATGGWQGGDMIVVAGRPSMGKTSFALNLAVNAAINNIPVGFVSLEMTPEQLGVKVLSLVSGVDSRRLKLARLTEDEVEKVSAAAGRIYDIPLDIVDVPGRNFSMVQSEIRRGVRGRGWKLVVVDYLQLMKDNAHRKSGEEEIAGISKGLKTMFKSLSVPGIIISQLSRKPDMRDNHVPQLQDLRGSGQLEQDADLVIFVYREDYYRKDDEEKDGKAQIILAKHRNGPLGTFIFEFDSPTGKFYVQEQMEAEF